MTENSAETTPTTREWQGLTVPAPGSFALDSSHASVDFVAKHMMFSKIRGTFAGVSGSLEIAEDPAASSVSITIDPATVSTGSPDRDGHLRSGDFFDIEKFPAWTFSSTEVRFSGGSDFVVVGDLTIRDVARSVELDATFEGVGNNPWGAQVAGFSARTEVDREQWGLTWNAALESGGVLVGKKVTLELEVQFTRS